MFVFTGGIRSEPTKNGWNNSIWTIYRRAEQSWEKLWFESKFTQKKTSRTCVRGNHRHVTTHHVTLHSTCNSFVYTFQIISVWYLYQILPGHIHRLSIRPGLVRSALPTRPWQSKASEHSRSVEHPTAIVLSQSRMRGAEYSYLQLKFSRGDGPMPAFLIPALQMRSALEQSTMRR